MKPESLVIVDQHATVNMYLSLVLPARHRPEICSVGSLEIFKNIYQYLEGVLQCF